VSFVILSKVQTQKFETETNNRLEMLETKEMSLLARLNSVELSNIINISQVESGKCVFHGEYDNEIGYDLYSYVQNNLILYYVEFQGNSTILTSNGLGLTSALCPPVYTTEYTITISQCNVNFPSVNPPSMINMFSDYDDTNNDFGSFAFRIADVSKISVDGEPVLTSYRYDSYGPCAPNTYAIITDSLQSGFPVTGFGIEFSIFFNNANPTFNLTILPGLRVPLRSFQIRKKK